MTTPVKVEFVEVNGTHVGEAPGGRRWVIRQVYTGWHLEFQDAGDLAATYAGTHRSLRAATAEAQH